MSIKRQSLYLLFCTIGLALLVFITYAFIPLSKISPVTTAQQNPMAALPGWLIGLMSGGIYGVLYTLIGLLGLLMAKQLGLPGIYQPGTGWKSAFLQPLWIGLGLGVVMAFIDWIFPLDPAIRAVDFHPQFPLSIIASLSAGIGEEIIFRGFVMVLWAFLFNLILRKWHRTLAALWLGNIIAALVFGASHFGSVMLLMGYQNLAQLPFSLIFYIMLLNGIVGFVAGKQMIKNGLVAAMGVHFLADLVWHVVWPAVMGLLVLK